MSLPDQFLGSFQLEKSENFDEYLTARGINWMLRKMMNLASITKTFAVNEDTESYTLTNKTPMKTLQWSFKLGQEVQGEGFDGKQHKITFELENGDTLAEKHIRIDDPNDKGETYKYTRDGDYMILHMTAGEVACKRFLKKVA